AGGPAVGMKPLSVGTLVSPASTVVASIEVKTLAISSKSLLILSAAASPSLLLLPLIGASSPDGLEEMQAHLLRGNGSSGNRWKGIDEVVGCDDSTSGKGV
nr:hypothetical protein [Tanacetum cinerariifolium]